MINLPYTQTSQLHTLIAGSAIRITTKPGFSGWDSVSPTVNLLAEALTTPTGQVALLGCGHGALAVALANATPGIALTITDSSAIALAMATHTLQANGIRGVQISATASLLPTGAGQYAYVLIDQPQSRALSRRWLVEAYTLLREGGTLLLAGPNELGIQSVIDDAEALFGSATLLTYRRKCRIVRAIRTTTAVQLPAWAAIPGIKPGTWHELDVMLAGEQRRIASLPGVFSYESLDAGTALLLANMPDPQGLRVLDIGCGYGVIGLAAGLRGAARSDMVDANILAVAAAQQNIERLQIPAEALAGDVTEAVTGRRYDLIVSNPPFHVGKQVSLEAAEAFVTQGRALLVPGGRMVVVANRFIRHNQLLIKAFGNCTTLADNGQYWVLCATAG